jgi:hypothetical membrane protein
MLFTVKILYRKQKDVLIAMTMDESLERMLLMGGIAAPLLLVIGILMTSAVYPGYSHETQFISELGAAGAPAAWIMNAVLILSGCLIAAFALAVHNRLGAGSFFGPLLIVLTGITMALSGIFVCDAACAEQASINTLHNILARALGATFILGILFTAPLFKNSIMFLYSIATVIVITILGVALLFSLYPSLFESLATAVEKSPFTFLVGIPNGIMQRIVMGLPLLWCFVTALYLRKK